MSKKDFQMIADVVALIADVDERNSTAKRFAVELRKTNRLFDDDRFLTACGV